MRRIPAALAIVATLGIFAMVASLGFFNVTDGHISVPASGCDDPDSVECAGRVTSSCFHLAVSGDCLDWNIFSELESANFALNAPSDMLVRHPQVIALIIDSTGATNFEDELEGLPGNAVQGATPISLFMEAEIVAPAFEVDPEGRQSRQLSRLNPTRWDWEVAPKREGDHQLEVSLYVIATKNGESIGEEKALAERRIINVSVARVDQLASFAQRLDPLRAFIFALIAGLAGLLGWFGIKSWKDISSKDTEEERPQKIEVTIKNNFEESKDKNTD